MIFKRSPDVREPGAQREAAVFLTGGRGRSADLPTHSLLVRNAYKHDICRIIYLQFTVVSNEITIKSKLFKLTYSDLVKSHNNGTMQQYFLFI